MTKTFQIVGPIKWDCPQSDITVVCTALQWNHQVTARTSGWARGCPVAGSLDPPFLSLPLGGAPRSVYAHQSMNQRRLRSSAKLSRTVVVRTELIPLPFISCYTASISQIKALPSPSFALQDPINHHVNWVCPHWILWVVFVMLLFSSTDGSLIWSQC